MAKYARLVVAEVFETQPGFTIDESVSPELAAHFSPLPEDSPVSSNWGYSTVTGGFIAPVGQGAAASLMSDDDAGNGNPPPA